TLVESLLAADLAPDVRQRVVDRAEGNPFFVEEVLGSLIDSGVLQRRNGTWHAAELPPGFEIPDSVQAVLAARIDLLGDAEKAAAATRMRPCWRITTPKPFARTTSRSHGPTTATNSRSYAPGR